MQTKQRNKMHITGAKPRPKKESQIQVQYTPAKPCNRNRCSQAKHKREPSKRQWKSCYVHSVKTVNHCWNSHNYGKACKHFHYYIQIVGNN